MISSIRVAGVLPTHITLAQHAATAYFVLRHTNNGKKQDDRNYTGILLDKIMNLNCM